MWRQMERKLRWLVLCAARAGGITRIKLRIRADHGQQKESEGERK